MKILRAADAFYARRREGPYRFIQNRSRISAVALKSDAAAEKPKDQLSRDFLGCSIFDFCNKIGTFRTWLHVRVESVMRLILLQKSFWGDERKFLEPLMRFTHGDVRDHIVSSKIDHGSP